MSEFSDPRAIMLRLFSADPISPNPASLFDRISAFLIEQRQILVAFLCLGAMRNVFRYKVRVPFCVNTFLAGHCQLNLPIKTTPHCVATPGAGNKPGPPTKGRRRSRSTALLRSGTKGNPWSTHVKIAPECLRLLKLRNGKIPARNSRALCLRLCAHLALGEAGGLR